MISTQFFTGGLVADPETTTTPSGSTVSNFRIGESDSKKVNGQWETQNNLYLRVVAWDNDHKPLAQIAAQLRKGDQVCVVGKLITRQYQTKEGENRTSTEVNAFDIYEKLTAPNAQQPSSGGFGSNQAAAPAPQSGGWGQPAPIPDDQQPPF